MSIRALLNSFTSERTRTSPDTQRRRALQRAVRRACLEALEARRLLAFAAPADYAVGPNPLGVASGDFNNDGRLDMVTANAGDNTISVLLGNADGTFQPAQASAGDPDGAYAGSLTVGDVNGDGNLDLATADY